MSEIVNEFIDLFYENENFGCENLTGDCSHMTFYNKNKKGEWCELYDIGIDDDKIKLETAINVNDDFKIEGWITICLDGYDTTLESYEKFMKHREIIKNEIKKYSNIYNDLSEYWKIKINITKIFNNNRWEFGLIPTYTLKNNNEA